ncbi:MAG: deoxyribodipyrimidine photolyase [Hydrogenophilales bacterium 28-61-23]|nr:MAG: deoxyribodipyrimidine photolyase [Hydrogenophilales bacterium 28-61-23]
MDTALIWFRRDLRSADNAALYHALKAARRVHAVFVFDTDILDTLPDKADRRVEFIWHSVAALKAEFETHGGALHVLRGSARKLIPEFANRIDADTVYAGRDYEPFAIERDAAVLAELEAAGRTLNLIKDHVIFERDEILTAAGGPYHVFTPYKRAWLGKLNDFYLAAYPVERYFDRLAPATGEGVSMPTLNDLGFRPSNLADLKINPSAAGAENLFADFQQRISHYKDTRNFPAVKGPSYLSVHLRFGTLSIRALARFAYQHGGAGAETWLSELIWRDFYQMLLARYPHTATHAFQAKFDALAWPNPAGHFEAWREARTGYPIVDAAMRQLNRTGYMHNRLRMIVASFLVKDLHVDWRRGERYFAEKLIDYDQAANIGGWQWSAGVGTDAQPWFRIFNPVTQSENFDPEGKFIRRYLPELAAVPDKFIHAPWKFTASTLDYPPPIVDHARARAVTLNLFKQAVNPAARSDI